MTSIASSPKAGASSQRTPRSSALLLPERHGHSQRIKIPLPQTTQVYGAHLWDVD